MKLFGKAKQAPSVMDSITKLRETLEMLEKRSAHLQRKADAQLMEAKRFMSGKNKRAALMCLKRKKTYENQIDKIEGARMTIETQVMSIEGANVSLEALNAIKVGAQTMGRIHQNMTVDEVDDTMEEIREQMEVANEINDAIAQPLGGEVEIDESELDELEQEMMDEQLLNVGNVVDTEVHSTVPPVITTTTTNEQPPPSTTTSKEEEEELAQLEASMAM